MKLYCLIMGHRWKKIGEVHLKYDPITCLEQHMPFALIPCNESEADVTNVKMACRNCRKTISYEA